MAVLRLTVECCRCKKEVDKAEVRPVDSLSGERYFECFDCFRKRKPELWSKGGKVANTENFYCEVCRYKFSSKIPNCPMCGKKDHVMPGNVTIRDLL